MNDWMPCFYAAMLMGGSSVVVAFIGFMAGRMREQLALLEMFRPEH
jgi:hypothetical protein